MLTKEQRKENTRNIREKGKERQETQKKAVCQTDNHESGSQSSGCDTTCKPLPNPAVRRGFLRVCNPWPNCSWPSESVEPAFDGGSQQLPSFLFLFYLGVAAPPADFVFLFQGMAISPAFVLFCFPTGKSRRARGCGHRCQAHAFPRPVVWRRKGFRFGGAP